MEKRKQAFQIIQSSKNATFLLEINLFMCMIVHLIFFFFCALCSYTMHFQWTQASAEEMHAHQEAE